MENLNPPHPVLTALEGRAALEASGLLLAMPLLRFRATRGHGEPVIVLPGFMATDRSTIILRRFINSVGYQSHPWHLGQNRGPMMSYLPELKRQLEHVAEQAGIPCRLVGWSRGGIFARELARDCPDLVDRVITIGTPVRGGVAASIIGRWVQQETGLTPQQMARFTEERSRVPISVPIHAIYSVMDGVVSWQACVDDVNDNVHHYEIFGSHVGMGANPEVFRLVPELLAN